MPRDKSLLKMDTFELFRSAKTAIVTNKTRSFLTTLGIIIGVAAVILLVSIGTGLQTLVTRQFADLGSNVIFVAPGKISLKSGPGRPPSFTPKFDFADVENLRKLGAPIVEVSGLINKGATAKYLSKSYDITLNGVDDRYTKVRKINVTSGSFISKSMVERSQSVVVIGPTIAEKLFGTHEALGQQVSISGNKFTIVGVTESKGAGLGGGSDQDSYAYIPISTSRKILDEKRPGTISILTSSPEDNARAAKKVKDYFYRRKLTDDDFTVLEPKEILSTITTFLSAITGALSGIAAISLLVGGIGIANIMLVSVTERTREIGLRKALGATGRDILVQFLVEAVMLSVLGGGIGIAIGWGMSAVISRFIETQVTLGSVLLAFGVSSLVGIVAGFLPALRASKLNPIEALRYE